jgi:hypothetical protein
MAEWHVCISESHKWKLYANIGDAIGLFKQQVRRSLRNINRILKSRWKSSLLTRLVQVELNPCKQILWLYFKCFEILNFEMYVITRTQYCVTIDLRACVIRSTHLNAYLMLRISLTHCQTQFFQLPKTVASDLHN